MVVRRSALLAAAASFTLALPWADAVTTRSVARQHHARSGNRLRHRRQPAVSDEVYGFSEEKAHRVGPGGCFKIWRNAQDRCMVQTECAEQNITEYSFSLVCRDKADGVVRHQFGQDSFDNEETFDTLIICKSCEPDALEEKKLVINLPMAGNGSGVKHLTYDLPKAGTKKLTYDLPLANESAEPPTLEEQVKMLTSEVTELKTDMEVAETAVQKLNARVFSQPPAAPCPAPPAAAPAAAAPPVAPVYLRARRGKHSRHEASSRHHKRQRVVEEQDDEQDDNEDEESNEVSDPPQPPVQAAMVTADKQQNEEEDEDDSSDAQQGATVRQACYMNLNELACEGECVWNEAQKACEDPNQDDDDPQQAQTALATKDSEEQEEEDASSQESASESNGSETDTEGSQASQETEEDEASTEESQASSDSSAEEAKEPSEPENDEE